MRLPDVAERLGFERQGAYGLCPSSTDGAWFWRLCFGGHARRAGGGGDAADETAEVVEENAELRVQPVEARAQMYVVPAAPAPVAHRASRPRSAPGSKGKAAFTLRLDPERHLKLRLACAVSGRSAQLLVTDALDQFLDGMPELEAMAQKAKRKG